MAATKISATDAMIAAGCCHLEPGCSRRAPHSRHQPWLAAAAEPHSWHRRSAPSGGAVTPVAGPSGEEGGAVVGKTRLRALFIKSRLGAREYKRERAGKAALQPQRNTSCPKLRGSCSFGVKTGRPAKGRPGSDASTCPACT